MPERLDSRAWVEVDLAALRENYRTVARVTGAAIAPMVKADAYGLGAARVVGALDPLDPWGYGVATAAEGAALRRAGVERPILVLGPMPPQSVPVAAEAGLTASISDLDALDRWAAAAAGEPLSFHVEIDTGMGRAGFDWRETSAWSVAVLARCGDRVQWRGVFTHFHSADAADPAPSRTQWQRFQDALAQLPIPRQDLVVHAANSAAALRWPEYAADLVRPGIFLYGGRAVEPGVPGVPAPRPVAAVRARVAFIRDAAPRSTVGYGTTYVARGWERWATVGIGYGDGLPRVLGNRGAALIRGKRVPMIGRTSMDMIVVDITALADVEPGEVVTLIGRDGAEEIAVDEVAQQAGTIAYEILTGLRPRLPRVEVG